MLLLVLNCGSATVKHRLFSLARQGVPEPGRGGTVEAPKSYRQAVGRILDELRTPPDAVAHRVVHGGPRSRDLVRLDGSVEREIRRWADLAPLHNGPALEGLDATRRLRVPQFAAFDTAFHRTLPERAYRYALPREMPAEVRRFGFHGLSFRYVTERYAELAGSPRPSLVLLHLGSGCSAAAVREGQSVDTSMGFTPLEGLVMGTRAGDVDPGVLLYLLRRGMPLEELDRMLHAESGLAGLAGSGDVRELLKRRNPQAEAALELFAYRARKYVGAYLAALGGAEAVVFTGGVGENRPEIRERIVTDLEWAGLALDPERNRTVREGRLSTEGSRLHAYVIPTDEEAMIARLVSREVEAG